LKIAYFVNQYPQVSHSFIRREILALERQGFEVQRLALRGWNGPLPDPEDQRERERTRYVLRHGLRALVLPTLRAFLRTPARFLSALRLTFRMTRDSDRSLLYHFVYLAEACRLLLWLKAFGALRTHAHFGTNSAEVAMLTHVLGGPPFSFTVHGPDEFLRPMGLEEKIHRSSFVVAISDFGRSQLFMRARHEDWSKVNVVHCGLEQEFYDVASSPVPHACRLVCVGRLAASKGQLLLLEAAARLVREGVAFELVLAGDGPQRNELETLITRYRLHDRVRITGWISSGEVREQILASRALVSASFAEGLPVVIIEAMALRRPVVATYVAGIPELVRHGETGWLVPAGSIDELVRALQQCLTTSPDDLARLGEAAYQRVLGRHSIDTEATRLGKLFRAHDSES
jgi:colanic acid/amylovoran biosynthesis glycosyltransferase